MKLDFFNSFGIIDRLHIEKGMLAADGWVGSPQLPIEALDVSVGNELVARVSSPWVNSPDVGRAWPQLIGADQCRFSIRLQLSPQEVSHASAGEVIALTPLSGHQRGVPLERIWPLTYGAPGVDEADEVGKGDFTTTSFEFFSLFRLLGDLRPSDAVLDPGCGIGRMAFALAHYLKSPGRYEGFDVSPKFIESARRRFHDVPNFRFRHVDVFNKMYNPNGRLAGDQMEFPYESGSFDFVFLTSVFTHMLPRDLQNYLKQIRRVLKPDGRCVATFFVIDDEAQRNLDLARAALPLPDLYEGCRVQNRNVPEEAIAYPLAHLRAATEAAGLRLASLHVGQWAGRSNFLSYQDVCLLSPA